MIPRMETVTPHAAHWGFFDAVVRDGRFVEARPFAGDAAAPPYLIASMPETVHSAARVDRPYIRKGWLEGRRAGHPRGGDAFVPVSWDRVTRLVAEETARVRAEHGDAAIFGGSYGWSSAGRFHHAKHAAAAPPRAWAAASPPASPPIPTPPGRRCCRASSATWRCCWAG
jgi:biotin/methionine sulfoxide reductase